MTVAAMWEAKAAPGREAELLAWAREVAMPALAGAERVELFSAPARVLLISWWGEGTRPAEAPDAPAGLSARPAHRWAFTSEHVAGKVAFPTDT